MHGRFPQVMFSSIVVVAVAVSLQDRTKAGERCCEHCGRPGGCQKTCRLVCEEKKVTTTCWGYKDEDFCVPGPSKPGCRHCETLCEDNNDLKGPCSQSKKFVWTEWTPSLCAKVYTKRKLMKRTVTTTVPSYKWVLEDLCQQCEANCDVVEIPPGVSIPPAPTVNSTVKHIPPEPAVSNIDAVNR